MTLLLDGEVAAVFAALSLLAQSPDLEAGNIPAFRRLAEKAVGQRIALVALLEASGQQVMSTFIPTGQPLPKRADMSVFEPVFRGTPIVSNIVFGTVTQRAIISIAVPVMREGRVVMVLSGVVYPERFLDLFIAARVNPKWAAAVVDRHNRFVSRNLDPGQYVGQTARPELGIAASGLPEVGTFENSTLEGVRTSNSFRRSTLTGWTSVVSVPKAVLAAPLNTAIKWIGASALTVGFMSLWLAFMLSRRITQSVEALGVAASALIEGKALPETPNCISELAEVRDAFELTEKAVVAQRLADERVQFLLKEVAHRSKNLLAVIQAVARQTARTAKTVDDFQAGFDRRLHGLAISHDLLVKQDWRGIKLKTLVEEQLAPFVDKGSERVQVDLPHIDLTAAASQALGLALHELATNANKHGALSGPCGKVTVTGVIVDDAVDRPLRLCWIESGGPPVVEPTRQGFGQVVIVHMVAASVGGPAEVDYDPAGFKWTLMVAREHFREVAQNGVVVHHDFRSVGRSLSPA